MWTSLITGTEPSVAIKKVRMALEADPSINVILSTGTADTEAAGSAVEKYFRDKDILCAGFDLSPEILRLVKAKIIRLTVDQQPYSQGYYAVLGLTLYQRYGLNHYMPLIGAFNAVFAGPVTIPIPSAAPRVVCDARRGTLDCQSRAC